MNNYGFYYLEYSYEYGFYNHASMGFIVMNNYAFNLTITYLYIYFNKYI